LQDSSGEWSQARLDESRFVFMFGLWRCQVLAAGWTRVVAVAAI
jgi:hypothetical protein